MNNDEHDDNGSTQIELSLNQAQLKNPSDVIDLSLFQADPYLPTVEPNAFDVSRYLPPGVHAQFVERGGALFIPHRINEFAVKIVKRRVDLVCFQCCLRFTLGFNRPAARLSHGFMARWTGLMPQNVRRGLQSLKEMGLIRVLVSPTNSSSTIYEVPIVRGYLDWKRQREEEAKGSTHFKLTPNQGSTQSDYAPNGRVYSDRLDLGNQLNSPGIFSLSTKKENPNKNSNSLRESEVLPHKIKAYISDLKPHRKRVEEEYHLQQLLMDYPVDDLMEALDYIQTHGALDTGEKIHSAMAYLSVAAEQVIGEIAKEKSRIARAEELRLQLERERSEEDQRRQEETREMNEALAAFAELDIAEQHLHIVAFKQTHYGSHGMEPPENVTHSLAARHWFASAKREQG